MALLVYVALLLLYIIIRNSVSYSKRNHIGKSGLRYSTNQQRQMFEMSEVSDHMMQTGGLLVSSISLMAVVNTKDANMS